MFSFISIKSIIHVISSGLEIPAIAVLIIFVLITLVELGSLLVEICTQRRQRKFDISAILQDIQAQDAEQIKKVIVASKLLNRQKTALLELLQNKELSVTSGQALARRLLSTEELHYQKILSITDFVVRLGPMFGLMATLIPLGPGLIALGQGDTKTLADSLLTAFDATVAGLATAGVAFIISRLRKRWYEDYMVSTETLMEGILEEMYGNALRLAG